MNSVSNCDSYNDWLINTTNFTALVLGGLAVFLFSLAFTIKTKVEGDNIRRVLCFYTVLYIIHTQSIRICKLNTTIGITIFYTTILLFVIAILYTLFYYMLSNYKNKTEEKK